MTIVSEALLQIFNVGKITRTLGKMFDDKRNSSDNNSTKGYDGCYHPFKSASLILGHFDFKIFDIFFCSHLFFKSVKLLFRDFSSAFNCSLVAFSSALTCSLVERCERSISLLSAIELMIISA